MFRQPLPAQRSNAQPERKPADVPLSPFVRYSRRHFQQVKNENPELQIWEVSSKLKATWDNLSSVERLPYTQEFDSEMIEYDKYMRQANGHSVVQTAIRNRVKGSKSKVEAGATALMRTTTEDEDEQPSELTARRMHAVRFDRNHRLISDLFNTSTVFDSRLVVPQKRLDLLQKQAVNLEHHKSKLEEELVKLDEAFTERKRQVHQLSENFQEKLRKVVEEKTDVTEEKYSHLVCDWEEKLKDAYADYQKKQEEIEKNLAEERVKLAKSTPILYAMTVGEEEKKEKMNKQPDQDVEDDIDATNTEENEEITREDHKNTQELSNN